MVQDSTLPFPVTCPPSAERGGIKLRVTSVMCFMSSPWATAAACWMERGLCNAEADSCRKLERRLGCLPLVLSAGHSTVRHSPHPLAISVCPHKNTVHTNTVCLKPQ